MRVVRPACAVGICKRKDALENFAEHFVLRGTEWTMYRTVREPVSVVNECAR